MAKTRAQRKAERRRREAQQARAGDGTSRAQRRTQVPESADVIEAELAEEGADLIELAQQRPTEVVTETPEPPEPPAPSRADVGAPAEVADEPADKVSRRARRQEERERRRRAKESERRRQPREPVPERQRGRVIGFLISCWAELKRVQWPNRETLIQASAVTIVFIAIAAAYLGALDSLFNFLVQHLL
jgi:preprotein translocase SecE subunit